MDVKTLYALLAVADHGSFNEAARALGVSLSSISVQMKALEDEVGLVLFDRSRRPPPLTDEGRDFVERARDLIRDWERLTASLKKSGEDGLLRLGAVHTVVSGLLPKALAAMRRQSPGLRVRLTTGLTHDLEAALIAGRIDVAVATEPATLPAGFSFHLFQEEPLVAIAAKSAPGEDFRSVLECNPYVRFNRQARVAGLIEACLEDAGIGIRSEMEIDTLEGVMSMVSAGLGVSIVPLGRVGSLPKNLKHFPVGDPPLTRRLGVIAPATSAKGRFVDQVLSALKKEASRRS